MGVMCDGAVTHARVQRELMFFKVLSGTLAGLLMVLAGVAGADEERILESRVKHLRACEITLEDEDGRTIGSFGSVGGVVVLKLYDNRSQGRLELCGGGVGAVERRAGIEIMGTGGERQFLAAVGRKPEEGVTLELSEPFRKESGYYPPRVSLNVSGHRPVIQAFGEEGKKLVELP